LPEELRYARADYHAENDPRPKATLDELTHRSSRFDRRYGHGSVELALDFAQSQWATHANLEQIAGQCPRGYAPFQRDLIAQFRAATRRDGPSR
jgi:hypothetical protein